MSLLKQASSPALQTDDGSQLKRLIDAVEAVAGQLHVLRQVLDEIREEVQWAIRNDRLRCPPHVCRVTSMPADPLAPEWAERLNELTPTDLPAVEASPGPPRAGQHRGLFEEA